MVFPSARTTRLIPVGLAVALFFLIAGIKWATFDRFGSAMPDWDQWDAEAANLYAPWFEHDHFAGHLFQAHNEHRVVLTKLQNLGLTLANGQWDARLEAATNATLHAALAVALWLVGCRWSARRWHAPLFIVLAALFGLPIAWQNVTGGFHSQQYWLLGTSFVAITLLPFKRTWSPVWWTGALAAVLAMFSMGSGLLASATVLIVLGFRLVRRDVALRSVWPTLVLTTALVVIGWTTRTEVPYHEHMKAKTVHDFFFSMLHSLQWPTVREGGWPAAPILWLPWVVLASRMFRARGPEESRSSQAIVALGGWVLLQVFATAYARGAGADFPASRYMDTLGFGVAVNALAFVWLLSDQPVPSLWRYVRAGFALVWLVTLNYGLRQAFDSSYHDGLPGAKRYYIQAEAHMRGYLATNDPKQLAFPDIPYPSADALIERLSHPSTRSLLPAVIRAPLPLSPATGQGSGAAGASAFRPNLVSQINPYPIPTSGLSPGTLPLPSHPTWGSFGPDGAATTGEWRSAPLNAPLGAWLKFETAGQIGDPGLKLELLDAQTGAPLTEVRPTKQPGDSWRAAYVRAPHRPFVVAATDHSTTGWLAFSAPVEMGDLSYLAWIIVKNGQTIAWIAATVSVLLWCFAWRAHHPSPATGSR